MPIRRDRLLATLLLLPLPAAAADDRLLLDRATAGELAALDGVGPELGSAIVTLREERGQLRSVEELRVLPGIDAAALATLREQTQIEVQLPVGATRSYGTAEEVLAEFADEPSIQEVQSWAALYAKTNPELVNRWLRQSRSFAALPELKLEYRLRDGWDQGWYYLPEDGTADTPDDGMFDVLEDADRDQDQYYTVQLSWKLDDLVMSSERIRVIGEVQEVVKLRDKVVSETTSLYFERRRLQVDQLLQPKSDLRGQIADQLRLLEMTANLDALTGGAFSQGQATR
jgi:competence ComEA-like helix-hairpin-helix protein